MFAAAFARNGRQRFDRGIVVEVRRRLAHG
jgi:hypothetical protein